MRTGMKIRMQGRFEVGKRVVAQLWQPRFPPLRIYLFKYLLYYMFWSTLPDEPVLMPFIVN